MKIEKLMEKALKKAGVSEETIKKVLEESKNANKSVSSDEMPDIDEKTKNQIMEDVKNAVNNNSSTVVLAAHEAESGGLENISVLLKGSKDAILAMVTILVHKAMIRTETPKEKLFAAVRFLDELHKENKEEEDKD